MTGKPSLHAPRLVNAEVVQDDVNLPGRVLSNYVRQELDELSGSLSVEDAVYECTGANVQCAEYAPLPTGTRSRNAELLALRYPRGSQGREQMDVAFVLVDNMIACHRRTENLSDGVHLCLGLRVICPLGRMPRAVVPEAQALQDGVHRRRTDVGAMPNCNMHAQARCSSDGKARIQARKEA